jgi:hypothetical protein
MMSWEKVCGVAEYIVDWVPEDRTVERIPAIRADEIKSRQRQ